MTFILLTSLNINRSINKLKIFNWHIKQLEVGLKESNPCPTMSHKNYVIFRQNGSDRLYVRSKILQLTKAYVKLPDLWLDNSYGEIIWPKKSSIHDKINIQLKTEFPV